MNEVLKAKLGFIVIAAVAVIIFFIFITRKYRRLSVNDSEPRPDKKMMPLGEKSNDKIILITNVEYDDIKKALTPNLEIFTY